MALNKLRDELWFVGDCQALVDDKFYSFVKPIDELTALLRSYKLTTMLENKEVTVDDILQKILQEIQLLG